MNYAIGVDLGGTFIKYALVAENGEIVFESKIKTEAYKGRRPIIKCLNYCLQEALKTAHENNLKVLGAGIGSPGIIDEGFILGGAENLSGWKNFNIAEELNKDFHYPIFIDNDANLMGLGEVHFGSAKLLKDVIFLTVGTGVGGAMVFNGQLYGGYRNRGAELGHIIVNINGELCSCGAKGCLEAQASTTALIRDYKKLFSRKRSTPATEISGKLIVEKYLCKEPQAIEAMNMHFKYLSTGITGFINMFSPQRVVLGGGISEAGSFYIDEIKKRVQKQVIKEASVFTEICLASLGNKAGFMGAAALPFSKLKQT